jgi:hypothetical protein
MAAISCVDVARFVFPHPHDVHAGRALQTQGFSKSFWMALVGAGFFGAGFADFALVAFHFQQTGSVEGGWVPVYYAVAMGTAGVAALMLGRLLDKIGILVVLVAIAVSSLFAPLVFLGDDWVALGGMVLWGVGIAVQDALFKAVVAGLVPQERRSTGFFAQVPPRQNR